MRRAALWGAVFLAQVWIVSASATEPGWIADPNTGCKVWEPEPLPNETISWNGTCENGMADGSGTLQWYVNGKLVNKYEGSYRNGQENGHGVKTYANGDRFEGEWLDGKASGHGVKMWANGDRYDGEYLGGTQAGHGVYTWANGDRYEGEFRDGVANGYGVKTWD